MGPNWMLSMYGFNADTGHIAVPEKAENRLNTMVNELLRTKKLFAIYIPQGTLIGHHPGHSRGRLAGVARLKELPPGKSMRDYSSLDLDGTLRWPLGWPCEAVYAPPADETPMLRSIIEPLHGIGSFSDYVAQFKFGPFRLSPQVASEIAKAFDRFPRLR